MLEQGLLVVISGPSGAGKGTVIKEILDHNDDICLSVSCTTRPPRPGETDGVTPIFAVDEKRRQGKDVVLEIDVQGALEVRRKVADALLIFIMPPSMEELERRLTGRQTETEEQIKKRFTTAYYEMKFKNQYDYVVVNDTVERAAAEIVDIINKEHEMRRNKEEQ